MDKTFYKFILKWLAKEEIRDLIFPFLPQEIKKRYFRIQKGQINTF